MSDEIAKLRQHIDALDERMVALLNERAALAREIGALKGGAPVWRPERESQVLANVSAWTAAGPLSPAAVRQVFVEIISASRALEEPLAVAYLGPAGTFSEMAVRKHFGASVEALACASIDETFRKVESGAAAAAVVPIENSTEGAIGRTMDLLVNTSSRICGEVVLRVRQNLMAKELRHRSEFRRVLSHPQSLGQCAGWLVQNLPQAQQVPVASNAEAARRAAEDAESCAIGPELAARTYGLEILDPGIEDDPRNMTRFLVLGAGNCVPTGRDRTSLVMSAPNKPGAVLDLIAPFARNGVSMSRIESRPARTGQWEYLFFIDIQGHADDTPVREALTEVRSRAPFLKVFGSYPAAPAQVEHV